MADPQVSPGPPSSPQGTADARAAPSPTASTTADCSTCEGLRYVPGGCCGQVKPCPACNAGVPVPPPPSAGPPTSTPEASAAPRADGGPVFEGSVHRGLLKACAVCGAQPRPFVSAGDIVIQEVVQHDLDCPVAVERAQRLRERAGLPSLDLAPRAHPGPPSVPPSVRALRAAREVLLRIEALAEHSAVRQREDGESEVGQDCEVVAREFDDIKKAAREFLDEVDPL